MSSKGNRKRGRKRQRATKAKPTEKKKKAKPTKTAPPDSNWKALLESGKIKKKTNRYTEEVRKIKQEKKKEKAAATECEFDLPSVTELETRRMASIASTKNVKVLGIDCEMVGVGTNMESRLARVCVINFEGEILMDKYCRPKERITDYRTRWSGIRSVDLLKAEPVHVVQQEVADLVRGRVVVGHSLKHDFEVLYLNHPRSLVRDTAQYRPLKRRPNNTGKMLPNKLKNLALKELKWEIQDGEHDPYIDARASLEIYKKHSKAWEESLLRRRHQRQNSRKSKMKPKQVV